MCSLQERERVFRASARSLSCLANRAERCESVLHSISPPLSPDVAASSRPRRKPPSATRRVQIESRVWAALTASAAAKKQLMCQVSRPPADLFH
jgi:hypothetical protein